jgi:thiol:disulfide interchange protein
MLPDQYTDPHKEASSMTATRIFALALALGALLTPEAALGQGKGSEGKVKAAATSVKSGGKSTVTITLTIEPTWYLYANPVGNEDFEPNRTEVTFTAGGKKVPARVEYPAGELKKDKSAGDYRIYTGKVVLKATVDSAEALEAQIKVSSCNEKGLCLLPGTVKVKVE